MARIEKKRKLSNEIDDDNKIALLHNEEETIESPDALKGNLFLIKNNFQLIRTYFTKLYYTIIAYALAGAEGQNEKKKSIKLFKGARNDEQRLIVILENAN